MRTLLGVLVVAVCLAPVAGAATTASGAGPGPSDASAAASGSTTEAVTITVSVVDADGQAVGGANVTVTYDGETKRGETFANGKAFFDVPEGADVSVDVSAPDLALNRPKSISSVDAETTVNVTMYPSSTALVTVRTPNGQAVEGAQVRLRKAGAVLTSVSGVTASNGTFVASDVERGNYTATVTADGYYSTSSSFVVSNRAGKTVTLEPGTATVEFATRDGHFADDRPVTATVELYDGDQFVSNISTGESGMRTVSLEVNTDYRVVVKKPGYERESNVLSVGESDVSATYAINRTPSLSVTAANSQVVTGQTVRVSVTDEYDEAVSNASVSVDGESVAETDANGEAVVPVETAGTVEVVATKGDLTSSTSVEGVAPSTDPATTTATTAPATTGLTTPPPTTAAAPTSKNELDGLPTPGFGGVAGLLAVALSILALARRRE
ncbi:carboxypeptidase regulatory-like domain-containing protein [Halorubellus sp. PRR65]|uniref:carboxypeptidase-like regulatory domain-containing protein n=1 Tax=Halorubellus sp. PRR65 TaxID=3098148 RepID=UPI002B25AEDB|nr:carboxypeptidase regulatory-like domain-containing protein [Halorubellus sp. PRR65]